MAEHILTPVAVEPPEDEPLEWEDDFIEYFTLTPVMAFACRMVNSTREPSGRINRKMVMTHLEQSNRFAERFQFAKEDAIDNAEVRAWSSATVGGDNRMLRWILTKQRPMPYGEKVAVEHTGDIGKPVYTPIIVKGVNKDDEIEPMPEGFVL